MFSSLFFNSQQNVLCVCVCCGIFAICCTLAAASNAAHNWSDRMLWPLLLQAHSSAKCAPLAAAVADFETSKCKRSDAVAERDRPKLSQSNNAAFHRCAYVRSQRPSCIAQIDSLPARTRPRCHALS